MKNINCFKLIERVMENTLESILVTDARGRILQVNKAFTQITGYTEAEALGKTPALLRSERHPPSFYQAMWAEIGRQGSWAGEVWNRRKTGEIYLQWLSINAIEDEDDQVSHYVAISHDLSELRAKEAEVEFLAFNDPLTRLGNRQLLMNRLDQALAECRRRGDVLALMILDVGRLRPINDHFGMVAGDQVICTQAERLHLLVDSSDTLVRLQGDTFAVLRHSDAQVSAMSHLAEQIVRELSRGITLKDKSLLMRPSVGIALFPQDAMNKETLIQAAEHAHVQAKKSGRQGFQFFDHGQHQQQQRQMIIEQELTELFNGYKQPGLELYFQPKICLSKRCLCGAEALLRWNHPLLGWISPGEFIPIAEQTRLCVRLDRWVIRQALMHIREWLQAGYEVPTLAVNLSAHQLDQDDFADWLAAEVRREGLQPNVIQLEITEGAMIRNGEAATCLLGELQSRGFQISLDDFGTGYSSLSYLDSLPLNELKIDRSFLQRIDQDMRSLKLLRSIVVLAQTLDLQVVVEGVEEEHQIELLSELGDIKVQGFYFYRPLPEAEFARLINPHEEPRDQDSGVCPSS
ncbi:putative bifunctional diguanylate cyclase/phosphodiesterase [Marinospirillum perlucidum]|uniref:putative bifunctional diguanylate cyclase/phosphodiesterase n=1 Tax=Marinospirillum perlucidum TaxID=1982602 RepID=UPI000DF26914|nr:GGDEF domain-containing phosphodiesterase [Marinospirillum perlucidum]